MRGVDHQSVCRMRKKFVQQGRSERRGVGVPLWYVEPLSDARTPLAEFFRIRLAEEEGLEDQGRAGQKEKCGEGGAVSFGAHLTVEQQFGAQEHAHAHGHIECGGGSGNCRRTEGEAERHELKQRERAVGHGGRGAGPMFVVLFAVDDGRQQRATQIGQAMDDAHHEEVDAFISYQRLDQPVERRIDALERRDDQEEPDNTADVQLEFCDQQKGKDPQGIDR